MKRIKFKHTIIQEATGDHPSFLMAKGGEGWSLIEENPERSGFTCLVKWDGFDAPFWANYSEFEIVK